MTHYHFNFHRLQRLFFHVFLALLLLPAACNFSSTDNPPAADSLAANPDSLLPEAEIVINDSLFWFIDSSYIDRFEREIMRFEETEKLQAEPRGEILFVGSSSIRKWETLQNDMQPLRVINRGFGGATTWEVLYYADRIIFPHEPSTIVYYAGENDLTWDKVSPEATCELFKLLVKRIHEKLPDTKIYFLSMKPSPARWKFWPKMQQGNALIRDFIETRRNLEYIDISQPMLNDTGYVQGDIFIHDRLHLNDSGYAIWTAVVKPILLEE